MAAVAAPVYVLGLSSLPIYLMTWNLTDLFCSCLSLLNRMGPVADVVVTSFGDTILVELGIHAGFDLTTKVANDLVFDKPLKKVLPIHSRRLETTGVKVLLITLQHKHTMSDAALGFYRSSLHS